MTLNFRSFFVNISKMVLAGLNTLQIIFLIAAPIAIIALVVFFIVLPINKKREKNGFREVCYKTIYRIAFDEDFYLINNFSYRVDSSKVANIDHVLFGNKYIYLIIDVYYEGDLTGKETDTSLILIDRKGKKYYTENQYAVSKALVKSLVDSTGIDPNLLIGIVVINNKCKINIETSSKQYYLIQKKNLKKLVRAIESRSVGNINAEQLGELVKSFDKINRTKKK